MSPHRDSAQLAEGDPNVSELSARGLISIEGARITYSLGQTRSYQWADPEEWVRARTIAFLIIEKGYPANRLKTEVRVPRRTPSDQADIVVFEDDACRSPYIVVENKADGQTQLDRDQAIEQAFGNANSLRAPFALYDEGSVSTAFDVANFPAQEREANRLGHRDTLPEQYGNAPKYALIAGSPNDIEPVSARELSSRIRRAHSAIWAGGRRDPLKAFDEWSKLLFAKVTDERSTATGDPRRFQVGTHETTAAVASRIHRLFQEGARQDPSIFASGSRIELPDAKIFDVVTTIQTISFIRTDIDSVGRAFENFFGSVFRGELGQYFTMRQLARFVVAALDIQANDFVIDPTAGSGGFLLEVLLQVWHRVDMDFAGQPEGEITRVKTEFALHRVFGIEIHEVLSRICKINLLLHHDGHTNIESDRSCLDSTFSLPRLQQWSGKFSRLVGNPPFGDDIQTGDRDTLGDNDLQNFEVAAGRNKIPSEQAIMERSIEFLEPGGKLGLVVPDGLLNNQGEQSNCPRTRRWLAQQGYINAIISLPDHAFRHSGAQNKTSILLFQKFSERENQFFLERFQEAVGNGSDVDEAIVAGHSGNNRAVFLAEANQIGYLPTGIPIESNELYALKEDGVNVALDGIDTILGEYYAFRASPSSYTGRLQPDCMAISFAELWNSHESRRIDPKYHLFKRQESSRVPEGWVTARIGNVMRRRLDEAHPEQSPDLAVQVMTLSQDGEIRLRESAKGRNPPEWLGMYFEDSSSKWFSARSGDVVFSSIDLWKGCISVVPSDFDGALVTKEFPIYEILDRRLSPEFLSALLRSRYYQRAFRAITTGHSNRRRTQTGDFENIKIAFPPTDSEQRVLIEPILASRQGLKMGAESLQAAKLHLDNVIDERGDEQLPEIESTIE